MPFSAIMSWLGVAVYQRQYLVFVRSLTGKAITVRSLTLLVLLLASATAIATGYEPPRTVPEPGTLALLAGAAAIGFRFLRKRK